MKIMKNACKSPWNSRNPPKNHPKTHVDINFRPSDRRTVDSEPRHGVDAALTSQGLDLYMTAPGTPLTHSA